MICRRSCRGNRTSGLSSSVCAFMGVRNLLALDTSTSSSSPPSVSLSSERFLCGAIGDVTGVETLSDAKNRLSGSGVLSSGGASYDATLLLERVRVTGADLGADDVGFAAKKLEIDCCCFCVFLPVTEFLDAGIVV